MNYFIKMNLLTGKLLKTNSINSDTFGIVNSFNYDSIKNVRIALGGVAHKPWRAFDAERVLQGAKADQETFTHAAEAELKNAKGFGHNSFKIELAKRTIVSVLSELAEKGETK